MGIGKGSFPWLQIVMSHKLTSVFSHSESDKRAEFKGNCLIDGRFD